MPIFLTTREPGVRPTPHTSAACVFVSKEIRGASVRVRGARAFFITARNTKGKPMGHQQNMRLLGWLHCY